MLGLFGEKKEIFSIKSDQMHSSSGNIQKWEILQIKYYIGTLFI